MRQKGLNNDSRTSWEYESAGKALTINWMLTTASKQANCEPDFDKYIGLASQINGSSGRTVSASADQCESIYYNNAYRTVLENVKNHKFRKYTFVYCFFDKPLPTYSICK